MKAVPIAEDGRLIFQDLQRLAFILDLGFIVLLSFSPGSFTRAERFMLRLIINKDSP